jgi:hypothetical protein
MDTEFGKEFGKIRGANLSAQQGIHINF